MRGILWSSSLASAKLVEPSTISLGRPARTGIANDRRGSLLPRQGWRGSILILLDGHGSRHSLAEQAGDDHDALTASGQGPDGVADPDGVRWLDPGPVDADMTGTAGIGGHRSGGEEPDCPCPCVHPNAGGRIAHPARLRGRAGPRHRTLHLLVCLHLDYSSKTLVSAGASTVANCQISSACARW